MKILVCGIGLLGILSAGCATASSNSPSHCKLTVELRDGSRVVGRAEEQHFDFHSDLLGEMHLPLEKIRSVESQTGTNRVKVTTTGGDFLTADFNMKRIRMNTSFGEVKLPVRLIEKLRVTAPGKGGRPMNGLVGLWSADGNGVNSVTGASATLRNVSFTKGVSGQAFTFAPDNFPYGTFVGVQVPDQPAYALTTAFTIEGWVRPRGNGYVIMCRGDHRPGMDPYTLSMEANHDLRFQICGADNEDAYIDADIPYCRWTHVAAVYNGDDHTINLYTNGVLAAQSETQIRPFAHLVSSLSPGLGIGNLNQGGINFPFVGDIDEIALYNRALSPNEIRALYSEYADHAGGTCQLLPARSTPSGMRMQKRFPIFNSR